MELSKELLEKVLEKLRHSIAHIQITDFEFYGDSNLDIKAQILDGPLKGKTTTFS